MGDIFKPGYEAALRGMIREKLLAREGARKNAKLTDAGFNTDVVDAPSNISIDGSGITFYWNQYEIAPYVMGLITAEFSFAELKGVLKDDFKLPR